MVLETIHSLMKNAIKNLEKIHTSSLINIHKILKMQSYKYKEFQNNQGQLNYRYPYPSKRLNYRII